MKLQRIAIAPSQLQNQQILLTTQQQHYLIRVLRLREGDHFIAIDGQGKWWLAAISGKEAQILEIIQIHTELPVSVTLMVALPKGNGFDEVVRCCAELGVNIIVPIVSDRTLLNPSSQKLERWQRIATEASEQSERQIVPTILEPISFCNGLSSVIDYSSSVNSHKYICVARGDSPHLTKCLHDKKQMTNDLDAPSASRKIEQITIIIATGPEGGWTATEIEQAVSSGFQPVSLGRRILRAVTAPVVALSLVAANFEG